MSSNLVEADALIDKVKVLARKPWFWVIFAFLVLAAVTDVEEAIPGAIVLLVGFGLYFLPSLVARKKPNASSVFVINLFFGWTLIGWVIALAMAANNPQPVVVQQRAIATSPPTGRTCPFCAEDIKPAAIVCKHCGRDLPTS